jgi:pyruvate/2-oxoglutarate dehydrogenase complex dihydrolipoamide acyltransferase (E2) component
MASAPSGSVPLTIPAEGIGMTEAVIVAWLQEPGANVTKGDPVAEIETDKSTLVLDSPATGVLSEARAAVGAVVEVGGVITEVLVGDRPAASPAAPNAEPPSEQRPEPSPSPTPPVPSEAAAASTHRAPHRLSPRARRAQQEASTPVDPAARARRVIAERVTESWRTIPHFAVTCELVADPLLARLARRRATEPTATMTDVLLQALAQSIGEEEKVNLGLAVATPRGVMIVVIEDVLGQSADELTRARQAAITRAREGRLSNIDLTVTPAGTLSNLGNKGVDFFTGIIPLEQRLLLTVGRIRPRVIADDTGSMIVRPTMFVTANVDHRALDGIDAAAVLERFEAATRDEA